LLVVLFNRSTEPPVVVVVVASSFPFVIGTNVIALGSRRAAEGATEPDASRTVYAYLVFGGGSTTLASAPSTATGSGGMRCMIPPVTRIVSSMSSNVSRNSVKREMRSFGDKRAVFVSRATVFASEVSP
jgi:hypothetical protein